MKILNRIKNYVLLFFTALCFAGCSNMIEELKNRTVSVESVTIEAAVTMLTGETKSLTATVLPENATDKTVTWSSSDSEIAAVDSNGTVTGKKAGTATITAKAGNKTAECIVTVKDPEIPVESVTIEAAVTMLTGETKSLTATVLPENATDKTVTWSSSDSEIAAVDSNGTVTGKKAGTATITAKAGNKTAECTVTVNAAVSWVISTADDDITVTDDGTKLTAASGYTSYKWYVDGKASGTESSYDYSALTAAGNYSITVEAEKGGAVYSTTVYKVVRI